MSGKKILFLMNPMQGYAEQIIERLRIKGFEVDWYEKSSKLPKKELTSWERCVRSLSEDFNIKKFNNSFFYIEKKYYLKELEKFDNKYEYIIDIGSKSSPNFMKIVKEKFDSKKILFVWDDLRYDNRAKELISYFDKVYSYCPEDSNKYNLIYRPSFYCDCFKNENNIKKKFDFFYVGNMRERDRVRIISKFLKLSKSYKCYIKLVGKFKIGHLDRWIVYKIPRNIFTNKAFFVKELGEFCKKSRVILDITIKTQIGLGLRPIEAIGAKCKLITTNKNIKNYDFYNENNIFILEKDFSNINKLKEFTDKPYLEYTNEIKYKYSIDGFIDEVLEGRNLYEKSKAYI